MANQRITDVIFFLFYREGSNKQSIEFEDEDEQNSIPLITPYRRRGSNRGSLVPLTSTPRRSIATPDWNFSHVGLEDEAEDAISCTSSPRHECSSASDSDDEIIEFNSSLFGRYSITHESDTKLFLLEYLVKYWLYVLILQVADVLRNLSAKGT